MSEDINWVFLRSFVWPHEYNTLKAFLESNGISIYMRDEMTVMVDPLLSNAIGGIKMFVAEGDFDQAKLLTEDFYKHRDADPDAYFDNNI